jgi:hypothetical protein
MPINFEDAEKPVAQRENEFRGVVKHLATNRTAVKSYTIATSDKDENGKVLKTEQVLENNLAQLEADKRKMSEAGNELAEKVTVRTRHEVLDDKKSIKVYLWAVKKINRKPKSAAK